MPCGIMLMLNVNECKPGNGLTPNRALRSKEPTTPKRDASCQKTKISHPYHPRCGEKVEIIRKCGGEKILVRSNEGKRIVVAADWTDIDAKKEGDEPTPTHLLDYNSLVQATELIEHLRKGESQPEERGYDRWHQPQNERSSEAQNEASNPKQKTGNPKPGLGAVELRAAGRGDPSDGTVGAQTDRSADRERPEGASR
jgi:hypothetical protein